MIGYFVLILYVAVQACLCQITQLHIKSNSFYSELFACCSKGVTFILLSGCVSRFQQIRIQYSSRTKHFIYFICLWFCFVFFFNKLESTKAYSCTCYDETVLRKNFAFFVDIAQSKWQKLILKPAQGAIIFLHHCLKKAKPIPPHTPFFNDKSPYVF